MNKPEIFFLTGAASGIGQHMADRLIAQGHRVFATDVNYESLAAHAALSRWPLDRVRLRRLDVRNAADWQLAIEEAVKAFSRIDVLMNIAGYMLAGWAHEASSESVERHLDINVKGVIFGTQAAARLMLRQNNGRGGGQIINIASLSALAPIPGIAVYAASKYAVRAFSIAAALELRPHNVFITTINPDAVRTPLLAPQKGIEAAAIVFSSPKLLTVEDVARAILEKAIPYKPIEVNIPRHRGWLAHLTNIFPQYSAVISSFLSKRGAEKQRQFFADQG
ncbi:MAG TPA: SDR family oxidoreductase [Blastocatellia bacterium]